MYELTKTIEYLFLDEKSAYDFITKSSLEGDVISSSVKYKKPTKTTNEGWIVTIKTRIQDVKELLSFDA